MVTTLRLVQRAAIFYGALLLALGVVAICAGMARASEPGTTRASEPGTTRASAPETARVMEPGRITVSRTAVVPGPTIKLGDLARLEGSAAGLADVDLGPAPSANAPKRLEGEAILRALHEAGMDASATRYSIPATVRVERDAREVTVDEIKTAVLNVALDALPAGEVVRDIDVSGPVRIPAGDYEARVSTSSMGRPGRRRFDVQLVHDGVVLANVPVTARTDAHGAVVVAKQAVPRGTILGPDDVEIVERNAKDLPPDAVTVPEQAIGMETKVALAAAAPLMRTALAAPLVVKKGDPVTMIIDTAAMRLTVAGEALESGAVGSAIKVKNRTSKQPVAGKVVGSGVVSVER